MSDSEHPIPSDDSSWPEAGAPSSPEVASASHASVATSDEEGFQFPRALHALRRRWALGVTIGVVLGGLVGGLLWYFIPLTSVSQTLLRVRAAEQSLLSSSAARTDARDFEIYGKTQITLIRSPLVISAALRKPGISQLSMLRDEEDPVEFLQRELDVAFANESEILQIALSGEDSEEIKAINKAVTDAYLDEIVFNERTERLVRLDILKRNYREHVDQIRDKTRELLQLEEQLGSLDSELVRLKHSFAIAELTQLRNRLMRLREALSAMDTQLVVETATRDAGEYEPPEVLVEDAMMQDASYKELAMEAYRMESEYEYLMANAGAGAEEQLAQMRQFLIEARRRRDRLGEEMAPRIRQRLKLAVGSDTDLSDRQLQSLELQRQMLYRQITGARKEYEELVQHVQEMTNQDAELISRRQEINSLQEIASRMKSAIDSIELDLQRKPRVEMLQPATIVSRGDANTVLARAIGAGVLTLLFCVVGLAALDYLGNRFDGVSSLKQVSKVRLLGTLPSIDPGRRRGDTRKLQAAVHDTMNIVRTALLHNRDGKPIRVVQVTSAQGQEGKSTVASQLAISFAKAGRRTLLVDADVRNPQLHLSFGIPFDRGFCEILRGEAGIEDVVQSTPQDRLSLMTAGVCDEAALRALAQEAATELFARLSEQYNTIILDSGPVLTGAEPLMVGQHAGATVLAVRRDVSRVAKIREAVERLSSVGINVVGAVVNGTRVESRHRATPLT